MSDDPYDWKEPVGDPASWSDADWLRNMARANFVIDDIARADWISARLETLEAAIRQIENECHLYGGSYGRGDDSVADIRSLVDRLLEPEVCVSPVRWYPTPSR